MLRALSSILCMSSSWDSVLILCSSSDLQVDKLMYQLNSDSEGDEGSDINPEEEDEEEHSESGEDHDSQHESTRVIADTASADKEEGSANVGPSSRSSALVSQSSPAAGAGASRGHSHQDDAGVAGSAAQKPVHTGGEPPELPDKQDEVKLQALGAFKGSLSEQGGQVHSLPIAEANTEAVDISAAEQDRPAYNAASASMPSGTAEQTLPYNATEGSQVASPTAEQTLPCGWAEEGKTVSLGKSGTHLHACNSLLQ